MARFRELKRRRTAVPGTVCNIQGPFVIEIHVDGPIDEPRGGGELQVVAIWQGEGMRWKGLVFSSSGEQAKDARAQSRADG